MILTVDVGNTRIKWALWMAGKIIARGVVSYGAYNRMAAFDQLFLTLQKPEKVFAVCVAGDELRLSLSEWVLKSWQLDVDFLSTQKKYKHMRHAYQLPAQHGADRWAAVVAAHQLFPGLAVCVIGAGTALTFDLMTADGLHLGGYILPSYFTMQKALVSATANIRSVSVAQAGQIAELGVPDNTESAVNQGLNIMLQAGIRDICRLAKQKMGDAVQVVITGGSAKSILSYPEIPEMVCRPDLVMQGLYSIKMDVPMSIGS